MTILINSSFFFQGENEPTEQLLKALNKSGKLHMVPASFKGKYVIRFTVTSQYTTEEDIRSDFKVIRETATEILQRAVLLENKEKHDEEIQEIQENPVDMSVSKPTRTLSMKRRDFGMSLILSHVPCSPKFINGSFAAIFDNNETIVEFARHLASSDIDGRPIRLSPRRGIKLKDQAKQHSLDFTSIMPGRRMSTGTARFKQGSLDTKVEDILDSTPDHLGTNGIIEQRSQEQLEEEEDHRQKQQQQQTLMLQQEKEKNQQMPIRSVSPQRPLSVPPGLQEKATSFLDKIKKLTPKKSSSSEPSKNGNSNVTNGIQTCPHCGCNAAY